MCVDGRFVDARNIGIRNCCVYGCAVDCWCVDTRRRFEIQQCSRTKLLWLYENPVARSQCKHTKVAHAHIHTHIHQLPHKVTEGIPKMALVVVV